jgi:glycosyltransferase involved in cell wall biosynthesis
VAVEVIVAVDGTAEHAVMISKDLPNDVTVVATGKPSNANVARNCGIAAASGELVALIDDDDEWLPTKLRKQVDRLDVGDEEWISTTQVLTVGSDPGKVLPTRAPRLNEALPDYLFVRRRLGSYTNALQTSTWLAPKSVFIDRPFDPSLRMHQDWDWIIRAVGTGLRVVHIPEALTLYTVNSGASTSTTTKWRESLEWALQPSLGFSQRAMGDYILSALHIYALRGRPPYPTLELLRLARQFGRPGAIGYAAFLLRGARAEFRRLFQ